MTGYKGGGMRGTATDASGGTDSFRKMNEIRGTENDDTFRRRGEKDRFVATAGRTATTAATASTILRFNRIGIDCVAVDLRAGTATVVAAGDGTFTQTLTGIEHIRGSEAGGDRLLGSNDEDRLETFDGKDLLDGRDGEDALSAATARTTLRGGTGADSLFGEKGKDRIERRRRRRPHRRRHGRRPARGRRGRRRLRVRAEGRQRPDPDFADGTDRIRIRNGADAFSDLTISGGANATITFAEVEIVVEGVAASELSAEDFLFG